MRTTASLSLIAALGLLSLSTATAAQAAPAKVGVKAASGGVSVKVSNPNRYAIKGSVTLLSGAKKVSSKKTSVKGRKSKSLSLSASGAGSVTVVSSFGKPGAKPKLTRTTVKVTSPSAPVKGLSPSSVGGGTGQAGGPSGSPSKPGTGTPTKPGSGTPSDPPPAPRNHWTGADGGGNTFGFSVVNGTVSLDQQVTMGVYCQQALGGYSSAWSYEVFDPYQGWALGNQSGTVQESHSRVNTYAGTSPHTVTYRLSTTQTGADTITGQLYESYANSTYDPFSNTVKAWNCSGTVDFTATRD